MGNFKFASASLECTKEDLNFTIYMILIRSRKDTRLRVSRYVLDIQNSQALPDISWVAGRSRKVAGRLGGSFGTRLPNPSGKIRRLMEHHAGVEINDGDDDVLPISKGKGARYATRMLMELKSW